MSKPQPPTISVNSQCRSNVMQWLGLNPKQPLVQYDYSSSAGNTTTVSASGFDRSRTSTYAGVGYVGGKRAQNAEGNDNERNAEDDENVKGNVLTSKAKRRILNGGRSSQGSSSKPEENHNNRNNHQNGAKAPQSVAAYYEKEDDRDDDGVGKASRPSKLQMQMKQAELQRQKLVK
eukprot:PhF_6_TR12560/c0_g1_i2/m.19682